VRFVHAISLLFAWTICQASSAPLALLEIPFQLHDGLIWVEVTSSASREPLKFLLDSGAQVSVMNRATAERLKVRRGREVAVESVGARTSGFFTDSIEANVAGVPLARHLLVLDLQKLSDACTNGTVDGIVGADFFRDRIVQIDFSEHLVRLLPEHAAEPGTEVLPLKMRRCGLLVQIRVNDGALQWVRLDTGCASALQWVSTSVLPERCTRRIAVALTQVQVSVTSTSVRLGERRFDRVPTDLHQEEIFPGEKGLLGNGLLTRFRTVTIDGKNGKLSLR
jgi:hypothetical protein